MSFFSRKQANAEATTVLSLAILFIAMALSPAAVLAQVTGFAAACSNVETFFKNFETILKVVSVMIVTIAIVFAGYQIAFAHKRVSDVAPILVRGLLIGGAAAIAGWFTAGWIGTSAATCT